MRAFTVAALGALLFSACAGPCAKVQKALSDFDAAEGPARAPDLAPDLALWLPYDRLDRLIAPQIKTLARAPVDLPAMMGLELGQLEAMVESIRVRPAAADHLGLALRVSLRSGGQRLLVVDLQAQVPPRIDPAAGVLHLELGEAAIDAIDARVDRSGTAALSAWVWSQLPGAVRQVTPRRVVDEAVAGLASEIVGGLLESLRDELPSLFAEVAAIEIELGDLPLAEAKLRSRPEALQIALRSDLPSTRGLTDPFALPAGVPAEGIAMRISGEALTAYLNTAMREGTIEALPGRFDENGQPDPQGDFVARASWRRAARPLTLDVFAPDGDCAHLRMAATPRVRVVQGELEVSADDARLEKVEAGGVRIRSAVFFGGLGRKSLSLAQRVATEADFEIGGQSMRAQIREARIDAEGLTLGLALGAAGPPGR